MSNSMTKLKKGVLKKSLAIFLAILMCITCLTVSVFAAAEGEEMFCNDKMNSLPTKSRAFFSETTKLPDVNRLNPARLETVVHSNGSSEYVCVDEQACYKKIVEVVKNLQQIVRNGNDLKAWGEDYYKYVNLPEKMRLADAIYRWAAENILYDFETYDIVDKDENGSQATWKPQDAYFVFKTKKGVCEGYARLTNLMMRIAGIPCMYVSSICGKDDYCAHAFNAVYIEDDVNGRRGWTLVDPTWASPNGSDGNNPNARKTISGTIKFAKGCFNVFKRNDNYLKELYNDFAIYVNQMADMGCNGVAAQLNRVSQTILNNLNQQYPDGSHFQKIQFYSANGSLRVQYQADIKAQDMKKFDANMLKSCVDELMGKSEKSFCVWPTGQADSVLNNLNFQGLWFTNSCFERINNHFQQDKAKQYLATLKIICQNVVRKHLKNIANAWKPQNALKQLNNEINTRLNALNNACSDITRFKNLTFNLKREANQVDGQNRLYNVLTLKCETALDESEIRSRLDESFSNDTEFLKEQKAKEDQKFYKEFFPAFYQPDKSIEHANKKVLKHLYHKLFAFEFSHEFWDQKINFPRLKETSHEGNAQIEPAAPKDENKPYYVPQELKKYGLEVAIPCNVKVLVLTGDELVNLDDAFSLQEVTGVSKHYILKDGNVYDQNGMLIFGRVKDNNYGSSYNHNNYTYGNNAYNYTYDNACNYTYDNSNNNDYNIYDNNTYNYTYDNNTYNYTYDNNTYNYAYDNNTYNPNNNYNAYDSNTYSYGIKTKKKNQQKRYICAKSKNSQKRSVCR